MRCRCKWKDNIKVDIRGTDCWHSKLDWSYCHTGSRNFVVVA